MLNLLELHLQAILPEKNIYRDYKILVGKDLFKKWTISVINGRIGRAGKLRQYSFINLEELQKKLFQLMKKRISAHKRIGVDYKINSYQFIPEDNIEYLLRDLKLI